MDPLNVMVIEPFDYPSTPDNLLWTPGMKPLISNKRSQSVVCVCLLKCRAKAPGNVSVKNGFLFIFYNFFSEYLLY